MNTSISGSTHKLPLEAFHYAVEIIQQDILSATTGRWKNGRRIKRTTLYVTIGEACFAIGSHDEPAT